MNLLQFSQRFRIVADRVTRNVNRAVRLLAIAVDQTLVLSTPVDTGRARSNWIVSLNAAVDREREPFQPLPQGTDPSKLGESGNAQAAINEGRAVIATRQTQQTIYITNNVPYIGRLNDGSSAQAPAMFVQQAVQEGFAALRQSRILRDL